MKDYARRLNKARALYFAFETASRYKMAANEMIVGEAIQVLSSAMIVDNSLGSNDKVKTMARQLAVVIGGVSAFALETEKSDTSQNKIIEVAVDAVVVTAFGVALAATGGAAAPALVGAAAIAPGLVPLGAGNIVDKIRPKRDWGNVVSKVKTQLKASVALSRASEEQKNIFYVTSRS